MGCDIHCSVEKRMADGSWEAITGFVSDYYDKGHDYFGTQEFKEAKAPIDCRNYNAFAVLADVRNGIGFAGCDTGNAINPIAQPKGLPEDVSRSIKEESDDYGYDGHSHSYITVKELLDYDTTVPMVTRGYVNMYGYMEFLRNGSPSSWCGGVGGGKIQVVDESEMIDKCKETGVRAYCQVQWESDIKDRCGDLFFDTLDQLKARCDSLDMDDVRLVFWFDN